jgi:hypothetical protein
MAFEFHRCLVAFNHHARARSRRIHRTHPSTSIDTLIDGIRIPSMPGRFQPPTRARGHAASIARITLAHIAIESHRWLSRATHEVQIHRSSSRSIDPIRSIDRHRAHAPALDRASSAAPQSTLARP